MEELGRATEQCCVLNIVIFLQERSRRDGSALCQAGWSVSSPTLHRENAKDGDQRLLL